MRKALALPPIPLLIPLLIMGTACDRKAHVPEAKIAPASQPTPSQPPPPPDPTHIPDRTGWKPLGAVRASFAGPHRGSFQRVLLNPTASVALDHDAFKPWPDGAQIVKEALNRDGKRLGFFWMSKEQGQWVWATGDAKGQVPVRFQGETSGACAACHMGRAAQFDGAFSLVFAGKGTLNIPIQGGSLGAVTK